MSSGMRDGPLGPRGLGGGPGVVEIGLEWKYVEEGSFFFGCGSAVDEI